MQKITRDALIEKAQSLLASGAVTRVLGGKKGDFDYDVTPALFTDIDHTVARNTYCVNLYAVKSMFGKKLVETVSITRFQEN